MHHAPRITAFITLAAGLALLPGCNKIDFGSDEGISYRSPNNQPEGDQDNTDWTSDVNWNKREKALFDDLGLDLSAAQSPALMRRIDAYPNPAVQGGSLAVRFETGALPANAQLALKIVDRRYKVVRSGDPIAVRPGGLALMLDLTKDKFDRNQTYRLYYVLYADQQLLYKGHGDVLIAK